MYGCLAIQSINFSSARARFNVQTNVKRDKTDTNNPEKWGEIPVSNRLGDSQLISTKRYRRTFCFQNWHYMRVTLWCK